MKNKEYMKIDDIDYRIDVNEILKHLPGLINLTQEFNQNGDTELADKTLDFMKGFLAMAKK